MSYRKKLTEIFNKEYKAWMDYTDAFTDFTSSMAERKEELSKKINSDNTSKEDMFNIQKEFVKFNLASFDLNKKTLQVTYFFMILHAMGMEKELDEEVISKLNNLLLQLEKDKFVVDRGVLKERIKGTVDEKTKEVMNSEFYKDMTEKV